MPASERGRMHQGELSQSIVLFISKLSPLYVGEYGERMVRARSLRDGSLVSPVEEGLDEENGFVRVAWRSSEEALTVPGLPLARLAVGDYVRFHSLSRPASAAGDLQHLAEHFQVKTGMPLGFSDDESLVGTFGALGRLIDKLGPVAALEAIKRLLGG